jgi:hypothetical protein
MANLKESTKQLRLSVASKAEAVTKTLTPSGRDTTKDLLESISGLKNYSAKNENQWRDVVSLELMSIHIELFKIFQVSPIQNADLIAEMNELNVALGSVVVLELSAIISSE